MSRLTGIYNVHYSNESKKTRFYIHTTLILLVFLLNKIVSPLLVLYKVFFTNTHNTDQQLLSNTHFEDTVYRAQAKHFTHGMQAKHFFFWQAWWYDFVRPWIWLEWGVKTRWRGWTAIAAHDDPCWKDQPEWSTVEFFRFDREEGKEDRKVQG